MQVLLPSDTSASLRALVQHLSGSANRWKTLIICSVFPPCPSNFKCNCTELDESASGLSKASASLSKLKGKSSHFRGLNQCQKHPRCLKVSDSPMIFSSLGTQAETGLKATENREGRPTLDCVPGNINGVCSHHGLTTLKDQNAEASFIKYLRFLNNKTLQNVSKSHFYFSEGKKTSGNLPLENTLKNIGVISYLSHRDSSLRTTIIIQLSKKVLLNKPQNKMFSTETTKQEHYQQPRTTGNP